MITGPLASMLLADLGADVVKVEVPETGDPFRKHGGTSYSAYFCTYNRNKRSIALDLKSPAGMSAFKALVQAADILIDNFRPGVMERLGLGVDELRRLNAKMISCSITGFGKNGPYANRPAYDAVAQAQSGCTSFFMDDRRLELSGPTLSDNLAGLYAAYGILGAYIDRERHGVARHVEINMLEATMAFFSSAFSIYKMEGVIQKPDSRVRSSQSYALKAADGVIFAVHMSSSQKFWGALLDALDAKAVGDDERFRNYDGRIKNYSELSPILQKAATAFESRVLVARLDAGGVPFAKMNSVADVFADEQVAFLETFFEVEHSSAGKVHGVKTPVWFDGQRLDDIQAPPLLGEHTRDILMELGWQPEKIEEIANVG